MYLVQQKARSKASQWDDMWRAKQEREQRAREIGDKKQLAAQQTEEAGQVLESLNNILRHTLDIDDTVDWESLKDKADYSIPKPEKPALLKASQEEPKSSDAKYVRIASPRGFFDDFLDGLFTSRRTKRQQKAKATYQRDRNNWKQAAAEHKQATFEWEANRDAFLARRDESNAAIEQKKQEYATGDPEALVDYCDMVLSNSEYPDFFPQSFELEFNPENRILIVDYQLPPVDQIPRVREVKYVQSRDAFDEKEMTDSQFNSLYDSVLYQVALRTIHELFEADTVNGLVSVVFNGYVDSIDPATGQEVHPCVLSVQTTKEGFEAINLANVDPKACFKKLKGVGSSKLHSLTPIPPILTIDREDRRFIEGYAVADSLEQGNNLAAMNWEDFEHLVRELFEKEFSGPGSEVRVTRASRDGGIDAVVFDPDPLKGGKIVIQAKRYTNTVGVSAVRDLYGTVINEGANSGILVTTSDYGPDAYEFAKGKPLKLLSGANLLNLLERHGHKAHIDLKEAKKLLE